MYRAQLFEGWLAPTQGQILIQISIFLHSNNYLGKFSQFILAYSIIKLKKNGINPNFPNL